MTPGTWETGGSFPFMRGLRLTLSTPWSSTQQAVDEFALIPAGKPDDRLLLLTDVAAVTTDGSAKVLPDVPRTAEGLATWFKHDEAFYITGEGTSTVAGEIPAQTFVVAVGPQAKYTVRECPAYPHCADLFTIPEFWAPGVAFGIGAPEMVRLHLATVGTADHPTVLVIGLLAPNAAELADLEKIAEPVIASLRLPSGLGQ